MIIIPTPEGFDTASYAMGEPFEVTATVTMTDNGLEVTAIDGMPVEMEESPEEEMADVEMDEAGLAEAMGRAPMEDMA